jgi:pyrroline-5-carboxylate reductase
MEATGEDAATLRRNVTSKGGTTAAALEILDGESGLRDLLRRAVLAAQRRSRELAGEAAFAPPVSAGHNRPGTEHGDTHGA